jgi:hypothetical protein
MWSTMALRLGMLCVGVATAAAQYYPHIWQYNLQPCASLSADTFHLPMPITWVTRDAQEQIVPIPTSIEVVDITGDELADLLFGYVNTNYAWNCIYINTGCGWVLQDNYTGPVTTCLPNTTITVRDVAADFRGLSAGAFVDALAAELALPSGAVAVKSHDGTRFWRLARMEDLAARPDGFLVVLNEDERYVFRRA